MDVLILRDPRESKKKCSLTPLRGRDGVRFVEYRPDRVLEAGRRILLHPDGDLLTKRDAFVGAEPGTEPGAAPCVERRGLLLIDCAWRRLPSLLRTVRGDLLQRRLPQLLTAYPRRSSLFEDPSAGLASVEALYAACHILGWRGQDLLDCYRWRDAFLDANERVLGGATALENE